MINQKHEIHDRIYQFVLRVLRAVRQLPKTSENGILIKQVVRSSGSIGANAAEADGAESKKEFIQQFTIAKKEAKETYYWLSLISDHNSSLKSRFQFF
jgi:four helix bundle protein